VRPDRCRNQGELCLGQDHPSPGASKLSDVRVNSSSRERSERRDAGPGKNLPDVKRQGTDSASERTGISIKTGDTMTFREVPRTLEATPGPDRSAEAERIPVQVEDGWKSLGRRSARRSTLRFASKGEIPSAYLKEIGKVLAADCGQEVQSVDGIEVGQIALVAHTLVGCPMAVTALLRRSVANGCVAVTFAPTEVMSWARMRPSSRPRPFAGARASSRASAASSARSSGSRSPF